MRTALLRALVLAVVAVENPTAAQAEHRCVAWAVPGAFGGAVVGSLGTFVGFKAAGADVNEPAQQGRNLWILGSAVIVGMTAGPIASCGVFDREPHAIPRVSFVIGGAALGATGLGAGWFAFDDWLDRRRSGTPDQQARGEGAAGLGAILIAAGGVGGGLFGYYLHKHLFRELPDRVMVTPLASKDGWGLGLTGTW